MSKNKIDAADIVVSGEAEEVFFTATTKVYSIFDDEYAEKVRDAAQTLLRAGARARDMAGIIKYILDEADYDAEVLIEEDEEYDIYYICITYPLAVEHFFQAVEAIEEIA